jgi:hypothetical protein
MPLNDGETFAGFRVVRPLGSGANGVIEGGDGPWLVWGHS